WAPGVVATFLAEGMALLWAVEALIRRHPRSAQRVVLSVIVGNVAAAMLNLRHLTTFLPQYSLTNLFLHQQTSLQYDHNAAGAMFVLVTLSSLAFLRAPWWRAASVLASIAVLLAGLWLTRSRTSMAALVVIPALMISTKATARRLLVVVGISMTLAL